MTTYNRYRGLKSSSKQIIACPQCSETMDVRQYVAHRQIEHDRTFNESIQCSYCPVYKWEARQKHKHGDHLYQCLKNFIKINKPSDPVPEDVTPSKGFPCIRCAAFVGDHRWVGENERLPDVGDFYPTLDQFCKVDWLKINDQPALRDPPTHSRPLKLFENREYDLPKILMNPLEFDPSTGLTGVPYWIKVYAQYSSLFDFYHVLIRAGAYKSFQSLVSSSDDVCMLPYTCLCDSHSGKSTDPQYIWHRHILLVTRNDANFQDAFKKIRFEHRLPSSYRKGEKVPIRDMYHWMNALYYVSSAEDQTLKRKRKTAVDELECDGGHHVSILIPMIPHGVAHMSLLVPDMIDYHLQEITKNKSVGSVKSKERFYQQWYAPAPEMTNIVNCPLKFGSRHQRIDTTKIFMTHAKNFVKRVTDSSTGKLTPYVFWTRSKYYLVRELGGLPNTLMNLNSDPYLDYYKVGRRQQFVVNEIDRNTKQLFRQIGNLQSQLGWMAEAMDKKSQEIESLKSDIEIIKHSMSQKDRETENLVKNLVNDLSEKNKKTLIQQLSESTSHVDQINILWNRLLEEKNREMSRLLEQKEREMSRLLEQKEREMSRLVGRIRQTERLKMQLQLKNSENLSLTEQVECLKREINQRNDQSKAEEQRRSLLMCD